MRLGSVLFLMMAMVLLAAPPCRGESPGVAARVEKPVAESIRIRQATQQEAEQWRADQVQMVARLEGLEREAAQLEARREALEAEAAAARGRIAAKEKALGDIEAIQAHIRPLLDTLLADLERQVDGDLPFLAGERRRRLEALAALGRDPDVAISEHFRKAMEALLVEAEYGNTIEVYPETIPIGGRDRLVNIFRLGRVALFYQALDGQSCGFFNVAASAWETLPPSYNRPIRAAMEIAARRQPARLLTLPLGRMRVP